jgi:hypothetical protein
VGGRQAVRSAPNELSAQRRSELAGSLLSGDVVEEGQCVKGILTGKWTYPGGRTLEGEFREGKPWKAQGILRHPDCTLEEGQWVEGKLTGLCRRTLPDGRTLEREFGRARSTTATVCYGKGVSTVRRRASG